MNAIESPRPPLPAFDSEAATPKVRMAEDAWNAGNPDDKNQKVINI